MAAIEQPETRHVGASADHDLDASRPVDRIGPGTVTPASPDTGAAGETDDGALDHQGLLDRVVALQQRGDHEAALALLDDAATEGVDPHVLVGRQRAVSMWYLGRFAEGAAIIEALRRQVAPDDELHLDLMVLQAGIEYRRERADVALEVLSELLTRIDEHSRANPRVLNNVGVLLLDLGAPATAREYFLDADATVAEWDPRFTNLVRINLLLSDLHRATVLSDSVARDVLIASGPLGEQLRRDDPNGSGAVVEQVRLARLALLSEQPRSALRTLQAFTPSAASMTAEHRLVGIALETRAEAAWRSGDLDVALDDLRDLDRRCREFGDVPGLMRAADLRSRVFEARGDLDAALASQRRATELARRHDEWRFEGLFEHFLGRARLESRHRQLTRAADELDEAARRLGREAVEDPLTGLGNRRALEHLAKHLADRDERVVVVVLDIDHFKSVNDAFGHGVGDRVLQHLAAAIRSELTDGDAAIRMGGDEFVMVLVREEHDETNATAERIRAAAADTDGTIPAVTLSIGCAAGPARALRGLLGAADSALYRAKASGRDAVRITSGSRHRVSD